MAKKATKKISKKKARKAIAKPVLKDSNRSFSDSLNELGNEKIASILQYVFPIGLIWFFVDEHIKKSKLAKFHLKQSIILVAFYAIWRIICEVLWRFVGSFGWIVQLALVVLAVIGMINAYNGREEELPVVGKLSKHLKF